MRVNYIDIIQKSWDKQAENYHTTHPEHLDETMHPSWGLWHIPETSLKLLDGINLNGKKLIDLGCGRGHDSAAYAKLGAKVLAVDLSSQQLKGSIKHENVEYLLASADKLPVEDKSYDVAVSDHGAFDHTPAPKLLKEMKRVLLPGGRLIICVYSPLAYICYNNDSGKLMESLERSWPNIETEFDGDIINVQYSYSEWIRMFNEFGFVVDRLEELIASNEQKNYFGELLDNSWGSQWPCDIVWSLRKE